MVVGASVVVVGAWVVVGAAVVGATVVVVVVGAMAVPLKEVTVLAHTAVPTWWPRVRPLRSPSSKWMPP
ncbi:MAG: hypothetical protein ACJ75M_01180 [Actinomycetes bacterium]